MSLWVRRCTDSACTMRSAIDRYAGRVNACSMRASGTWLHSMTALISGTARNDGFSRNVRQYAS